MRFGGEVTQEPAHTSVPEMACDRGVGSAGGSGETPGLVCPQEAASN